MNHMTSIARSAVALCARFIAQFQHTSKGLGSTQLTASDYQQAVDKAEQKLQTRLRHAHVIHMLDTVGTLSSESPSRAHRKPLRRIACGVAFVIVTALSFGVAPADGISNTQITSVKELANKQLTEKQEYCHNQITFKESSNSKFAINGSHYGYYQGKSKSLLNAPDDYQFYWYWSYVAHRYGITQYDEPNYCKALHHLRVKGWQ
jgi:hypothetical protein